MMFWYSFSTFILIWVIPILVGDLFSSGPIPIVSSSSYYIYSHVHHIGTSFQYPYIFKCVASFIGDVKTPLLNSILTVSRSLFPYLSVHVPLLYMTVQYSYHSLYLFMYHSLYIICTVIVYYSIQCTCMYMSHSLYLYMWLYLYHYSNCTCSIMVLMYVSTLPKPFSFRDRSAPSHTIIS